jgi:hypothetical protein
MVSHARLVRSVAGGVMLGETGVAAGGGIASCGLGSTLARARGNEDSVVEHTVVAAGSLALLTSRSRKQSPCDPL